MKVKLSFSDIVNYKEYYYFYLCLISGLILGIILINNSSDSIYSLLKNVLILNDFSFLDLLINSIFIFLLVTIFVLLLGFSIIGKMFIYLIPTCYGLSLGIKISYIVALYSIKGLGYLILMIVPEFIAVIIPVSILCVNSISFSNDLLKIVNKKPDIENIINVKQYLVKYIKFGLIFLIITNINSIVMYLLSTIIRI